MRMHVYKCTHTHTYMYAYMHTQTKNKIFLFFNYDKLFENIFCFAYFINKIYL